MSRRAARFELGSVVADRRIDSVAGEGGMGVVYRAWNLRLKRVEAVKVIAEDFVRDRSFRERFARETEIAANIDHPHVVTLYDSGEGPGGQLFIAMQYVEGTTLERLIGQRGRLEPALAATLISQVASALDAAHAQGLVHRDVKPANVLIAGSEGGYQAYLTDFGLAKRVASKTVLTGVGLMLGTVDYMAPEQAHGRPVDLGADVYALGATLFKALTGEVPYPREGEIARLFAKLGEPPPMASQVATGVPPAFDAVIARAMAENPAERYSSAGELGRVALVAARTPTQVGSRPRIGSGAMLGDCLLEDIAGEGGMAVVYRAKQIKLGRTVAVKVMSKELAEDPAFRARFEREWRIAASIDHPNVVPIYWAGEAQGVLYIVMRFIGGGSLKEALLLHGRLEPERAVEVIEQIGSALDAGHARGLVHRDIKPGNVLIDDESGRVFLTDFGLAKSIDDTDITDAREILGTARYMAPERNGGTTFDEVRSDVYALGCVLWDLLGGTERLKLTSVAGVPPGLARVVLRAIDPEPAARHASAGELARAARASLSGVVEEPVSPTVRAGTGPPARSIKQRREPFAPEPLSRGLCERVLALCDSVLGVMGDEATREPLLLVRHELAAPLRLAIVGGSGSGRATLLGALLGRRVGGVQSADSIGVDGLGATISFAHGSPERIEAELADGTRVEHALAPDGSLPAEMAAVRGPVTGFRAWLPIDSLRTVSLIYPALGDGAAGPPLPELANAFLVAVPRTAEGNTEVFRAAVLDALAGVRCSAVNSSCVLTTADPAGGAIDAGAVKRALGPLVAGAVPFSGVLGLAANTGVISEQIVDDLARMAGLDEPARTELLRSEQSLLAAAGPLSIKERRRLVELIGLGGIRTAAELADAGELTAIGLTRRLRELSGIEGVHREIDGLYQRADALKAAHGLASLEQLSYRWPELAFLRDQVEATRFEPRMHVLGLVGALERCVADDVDLPAELLAGLERLVTAPTPSLRLGIDEPTNGADLARAALAEFRSWKMFENGSQASPRARRMAQVVTRSLRLIAKDADQALARARPDVHG